MQKIKKGIKKKIKGKKGKHDDDEIFTEEELEQYKKEKAEEARRLAEEQQQQHSDHPLDEEIEAEPAHEYYEPQRGHDEEDDSSPPEAKADNSNWKSFLASTDTVLKTTSDNLEHIKESSYFQSKKGTERGEALPATELVESFSQRASASTSPVLAAPAKGWVDLEKGGFNDQPEEDQVTDSTRAFEPESPPKKKFVELKPIEDLPDVSAEDYADVFDTAYVDEIESGDLKLIIPDSPIEDYSNEPDPFDTSVADRVLHIEEPKPEPVPKVVTGARAKQAEAPKKRKLQLVSLGNAVDVLTGKASTKAKVDESKQVNLLGDFDENDTEEGEKERKKSAGSVTEDDSENKGEKKSSETAGDVASEASVEQTQNETNANLLDDILFGVDEPLDNLPELGVPIVNKKEAAEDGEEKDSNSGIEFDELLNTDQEDTTEYKAIEDKHVDIKDLVSEFDVFDNIDTVEDSLIPKLVDDPILDEFDAEFASLAHESVAKAKDKEIDDIGLEDEDDPFDTSHFSHVLGDEKNVTEKDPFDVEFCADITGDSTVSKKGPSRPPLPTGKSPKSDIFGDDPSTYEDVDPFDTSVADKILPVDHLETTANDADLADTLEPSASERNLTKSDSFDPFDTSAADAFGITELKVLENELLPGGIGGSQLKNSDFDFDFNPREEEEEKNVAPDSSQSTVEDHACLLTSGRETNEDAILTPQEKQEVEELDPFDTSIADKIQIKSLEDELLEKPNVKTDNQLTSEPTLKPKSKPPPRPASPACLLVSSPVADDINPALQPLQPSNTVTGPSAPVDDDEIDPFDTSIAEAYGRTELKVLESEFLTDTQAATPSINPIIKETVEPKPVVKDTLALNIKPPRPPSPACLLAATPLDENPTLVPQTKPSELDEDEDFDPFDTSIAQQFGKTELHVLESELLTASPSQSTVVVDDFDPRAVSPQPSSNKPPRPQRPASPVTAACLLTATPDTESPADLPIAPSEIKKEEVVDDFDPFDTSIADKFGTTELKHLEDELLSKPSEPVSQPESVNTVASSKFGNTLTLSSKPERPPVPSEHCLLATTPTDCSQPLQPFTKSAEPKLSAEPEEDFDPFDTSIANQFGKTEIQELEQSFLTSECEPVKPKYSLPKGIIAPVAPSADIDPFDTTIADQVQAKSPKDASGAKLKRTLSDEEFNPRSEDSKRSAPLDLLDSAEDASFSDAPIPVLQPKEVVDTSEIEDIDPFDTSIAASILPGKTELKLLESELLNN